MRTNPTLDPKRMRTNLLLDLKLRSNLGRTSGKNPLVGDWWISLTYYKVTKSVAKTSSKVQKPQIYDEAINNVVYGNKWWEIIDNKLWNLDTHQTWAYISLTLGQKAISCKWVFKVKYNLDGSIKRYKPRLVTQKFSQVYRIDYTEIFALIIKHKLLRIFLVIAIILGIILVQINTVRSYLESAISQNKQPIYMRIPRECLVGREGLVCKILKSLYKLKQVRKLWNKTLIKFF